MMINRELIGVVPESRQYIAKNVLFQWFSLVANIILMFEITTLIQNLYEGTVERNDLIFLLIAAVLVIFVRFICIRESSQMAFMSSKSVKLTLREKIYRKLLALGASYEENVSTAELVQETVEGVDQLETYFGSYLPQFFYAMLAPVTLFIVMCFISVPSAIVLLVCVPLIPLAIAGVQTWAKKVFSKYWDQYTALGDSFLENLEGLTTLKIYQSDGYKHKQMNEEAENFRRVTMKVLTMQLNSITIMDIIAYGGAALGLIVAVLQFRSGNVALGGCLFIILIAADFFIPMRQLGSYFHVAMNGMSASDKIFAFLSLPEEQTKGTKEFPASFDISLQDVYFSYEENREILHGVKMDLKEGSFTAIVGESGSGKTTVASIIMGRCRHYTGQVLIGGEELFELSESGLMQNITYVGTNSYLFKGTVRGNLQMGNPQASDDDMWRVLRQVKLAPFFKSEFGLDTKIEERAANLSGGQRQRLALARALLHDSPVYIFDEATSNIDAESENDIMEQIHLLAKKKTVILISHRLLNVVPADCIYVMDKGCVVESGTHGELLKKKGTYEKLFTAQQNLENYRKGGATA